MRKGIFHGIFKNSNNQNDQNHSSNVIFDDPDKEMNPKSMNP